MKNILAKSKGYILKHKFISIVALVVIIIIAYWIIKSFNNTAGEISYVTESVKIGNIITTVSGTGQVSAVNQVDLKTKVSGDLTYLNVKVGQEVQKWDYIAQIDNTDVAFQLENAKLSYDKLITVDQDTLRKYENTFNQATINLANSYTNARISLASDLTDLSDLSVGLGSLIDYNTGYLSAGRYSLSGTAKDYRNRAEDSWYTFDNLLKKLSKNYNNISSSTTETEIEKIVSDFYAVAISGSQASKNAQDATIYLKNNEDTKDTTTADTAYTSVVSLVSKANTVVSSITTLKSTIDNNIISLDNATADLNNLKAGPDTLSLRQSQLSVNQAQETLNNYSVVAPFAGVIASVADVNIGDTVSSGTTIATLITKQKIAEISLNEIDAAKVKVGQKANLTFDAFDGLNIVGTVAEVNLIGTISQGVVSYTIKISFDTQDDRVKSSMSVNASIITEAKTDVLTVVNSAIKTQGNSNYVEIPGLSATDLPTQQIVTVGISNDTVTEVVSGLKEGDLVVTKTMTGTATQTTTKTPSVSSILGGGSRMAR